LDPSALDVLINDLFPLARLITPNKAEAELLLSRRHIVSQISGLEDMLSAAHDLLQFGSRAVLLKGGHIISSIGDVDRLSHERPDIEVVRHGLFDKNMEILQVGGTEFPEQLVVDVLSEGNGITLFVRPHIETTSTHGTGCTLSAAITAELARGNEREYLNRDLLPCCLNIHIRIQSRKQSEELSFTLTVGLRLHNP
jgi:hydroxymethylpyrimidine/phosphomethylpyrimidine kinase